MWEQRKFLYFLMLFHYSTKKYLGAKEYGDIQKYGVKSNAFIQFLYEYWDFPQSFLVFIKLRSIPKYDPRKDYLLSDETTDEVELLKKFQGIATKCTEEKYIEHFNSPPNDLVRITYLGEEFIKIPKFYTELFKIYGSLWAALGGAIFTLAAVNIHKIILIISTFFNNFGF